MSTIHYSTGLRSLDASIKTCSLTDFLHLLETQQTEITKGVDANTYEYVWKEAGTTKDDRAKPTKPIRAFVDIDGKASDELTEEDFDVLDISICEALKKLGDVMKTQISLMTSSKFSADIYDWNESTKKYVYKETLNKLSYRVTFTHVAGSSAAVKRWIQTVAFPAITKVLNDNVEIEVISEKIGPKTKTPATYVNYDDGVYTGQKMRCCGATKPFQKRPYKLIKGDLIDTILSHIPEECKMLLDAAPAAPKQAKKAVVAAASMPMEDPAEASKKLLVNVVNALSPDCNYADWLRVGCICFNEGMELEVWDSWSKGSGKYKAGECAERWATFGHPQGEPARKGSLWKALKEHNPTKYKELHDIRSTIEGEEEIVGRFYKIADFQDMKEKFEETNFFVKDLVCMCNIRADGSYLCYSMKDAGFVYEAEWRLPARKSSGESTTIEFFDVWRKCPTRKVCTKLVFKDPAKTEPGEFSIFHGFRAAMLKAKGVEPSAAGLAKWLELVANLSNGDAAVYDHTIKYMAHTIQKPFIRADVSLINSGPKGVGKDLCWNTLGYGVIGPDLFQNITDIEKQLLNTHETSLEGKVLIKLEEANEHIMLKYKNYIKSLVTQTYARINKKNITPYNIETYYRIVMTSNYVCPASLEDGERRFALYPVGAAHKGDNTYWEETAALLAEDATAVAIFDYLNEINLSKFNPRNYVETEVAKAIIITEFKSEDAFLLEFSTNKLDDKIENETVRACVVYDAYKEYCVAKSVTPKGLMMFSRALTKHVSSGSLISKKTRIGIVYTIDYKRVVSMLA